MAPLASQNPHWPGPLPVGLLPPLPGILPKKSRYMYKAHSGSSFNNSCSSVVLVLWLKNSNRQTRVWFFLSEFFQTENYRSVATFNNRIIIYCMCNLSLHCFRTTGGHAMYGVLFQRLIYLWYISVLSINTLYIGL